MAATTRPTASDEATSLADVWVFTAALAVFGFLGALDQNVIVTALPRMLNDTKVPIVVFSLHQNAALQFDRAGWLVTGYLLGYVAVLPLMGAVSDVYGRRQVMLLALAIFAAGSVVAALAGTLPLLVIARTVQALGAGAFLPVALAAAADVVSPVRQGVVLGLIAASAELGGVFGPLYGAFISEHNDAGWRLIFWLNVPIVLLLAPLTLVLPALRRPRAVDYRGGAVLGLALVALVIGTSSSGAFGSTVGGGNANRWLLAVCAVLLTALWPLERRLAAPLLPRLVIGQPRFLAACLVNLLVGVALGVAIISVPIYATTVLDISQVQGGLLLLRYLAALVVGAAAGGWLRDHVGSRPAALLGLAIAAVGYWLMGRWMVLPPQSPSWFPPALAGLGIGLVAAPVTAAALGVTSQDHGGVLASLVTTARVIGTMVGLSGLTSWASYRFQQLAATVPLPRVGAHGGLAAFQRAATAYGVALQRKEITVLQDVFVFAALGCAVALLPALLLGDRVANG